MFPGGGVEIFPLQTSTRPLRPHLAGQRIVNDAGGRVERALDDKLRDLCPVLHVFQRVRCQLEGDLNEREM